jgi:hypothetical protein
MSRVTRVDKRDREWLDALIASVSSEGGTRTDRVRAAVSLLRSEAEAGSHQAERVLRALEEDGCRSRVETWDLSHRARVWVANGSLVAVDLPERPSVQRIDRNGARTKDHQPMLWTELTWEEFAVWLNVLAHRAKNARYQDAAARQIYKLREQYPNTRTPGEACELAGIDPADFKLVV